MKTYCVTMLAEFYVEADSEQKAISIAEDDCSFADDCEGCSLCGVDCIKEEDY